jgi:hypothetical protein
MGKKPTQDEARPDMEWLESLEARVREASERLRELSRENARLAARVEELEGGADPDEAATAWRQERDEIRGRVERLTESLESLLGDD